MKNLIKFLILVQSIFLFSNCNEDNTSPKIYLPPEESSINFQLSVFPDIGSTETSFEIYPTEFSDTAKSNLLKFKYDFDGDGAYDTDWVDSAKITHQYIKPGKKIIKVEMRDNKGDFKFAESVVYVGLLDKVKGTDPIKNINEPNFAKDGTNRIVYNSWDEGHQLFIADLDAETVTQLTYNDGSEEINCKHVPDWSPDGKQIAVDYKDGTFLVDAVTGNLTKFSSLNPVYLEYSPDGKKLILLSGKEEGTYILNIETNEEVKFSDRMNGVCWSPDGTQIAEFDYTNEEVKILNADDGSLVKTYKAEKLQRLGDRSQYMDWSADGKWIHLCHYAALLNTDTGKFYSIVPGVFKRKQWAESAMNKDVTMIAFTNSKEEDQVDPIYLFKIPNELKD